MTRSTASRRARNSDSVRIGGRVRRCSRPSRRRWRLASSRVEPETPCTSSTGCCAAARLADPHHRVRRVVRPRRPRPRPCAAAATAARAAALRSSSSCSASASPRRPARPRSPRPRRGPALPRPRPRGGGAGGLPALVVAVLVASIASASSASSASSAVSVLGGPVLAGRLLLAGRLDRPRRLRGRTRLGGLEQRCEDRGRRLEARRGGGGAHHSCAVSPNGSASSPGGRPLLVEVLPRGLVVEGLLLGQRELQGGGHLVLGRAGHAAGAPRPSSGYGGAWAPPRRSNPPGAARASWPGSAPDREPPRPRTGFDRGPPRRAAVSGTAARLGGGGLLDLLPRGLAGPAPRAGSSVSAFFARLRLVVVAVEGAVLRRWRVFGRGRPARSGRACRSPPSIEPAARSAYLRGGGPRGAAGGAAPDSRRLLFCCATAGPVAPPVGSLSSMRAFSRQLPGASPRRTEALVSVVRRFSVESRRQVL